MYVCLDGFVVFEVGFLVWWGVGEFEYVFWME